MNVGGGRIDSSFIRTADERQLIPQLIFADDMPRLVLGRRASSGCMIMTE